MARASTAGPKPPRIGARTCGELARGASDREIRGSDGLPPNSPAASSVPRVASACAPGSFPGLAPSALARRRLGGRGRWAPAWVCVGVFWLWGLMACLFVKPPPRLQLIWGETKTGTDAVYLPLSLLPQEGRAVFLLGPFTGQRFSRLHLRLTPYFQKSACHGHFWERPMSPAGATIFPTLR